MLEFYKPYLIKPSNAPRFTLLSDSQVQKEKLRRFLNCLMIYLLLEMKEAWKKQRDGSNTSKGLLFRKEPCGGGTQKENRAPSHLQT
jgi:hypothetical protein